MRAQLPRRSGILVLVVAAGAAPAASGLDLREVCDSSTVMTPVGIDTKGGASLFSMPSRQSEIPGWMLRVGTQPPAAELYLDTHKGQRFGGSTGPGAIVAFTRCGLGCVQPVSWNSGDWEALGGSITGADRALVHTVVDRSGTAWVVLHRATEAPGVIDAEGYRLEQGHWVSRGALRVKGVGSPGVRPDPAIKTAVISGSGRFSPDGATFWVDSVPTLQAGEKGHLVPIGARTAAVVTTASNLYTTTDGGRSWSRQLWTPWGDRSSGDWQAGQDYSVDLPDGAGKSRFPVLWEDRRFPAEAALILSEWMPSSSWRVISRLPQPATVEHVARLDDRSWLIVEGCRSTQDGLFLALRRLAESGSPTARLLPITPMWLD